jgi:hypothetical protein
LILIDQCNTILETYDEEGFDLTLRQLYYQLVSKNIIENNEKSYTNIGNIVSDARMTGLIDWNHIVDRVRHVRRSPNWNDPTEILRSAAVGFHLDWWSTQEHRIELWVEKEALIGVIEKVGLKYDIPYYTTKGFNSQTEMWSASQRFIKTSKNKQQPVVLYVGDHDPSGLDMTRDMEERLWMFGTKVDILRVALNYDQVLEMNLPENPAKKTDPRYKSYRVEYGTDKSWELDAIPPSEIVEMLSNEVEKLIDFNEFDLIQSKEEEGKKGLTRIADQYPLVMDFLQQSS